MTSNYFIIIRVSNFSESVLFHHHIWTQIPPTRAAITSQKILGSLAHIWSIKVWQRGRTVYSGRRWIIWWLHTKKPRFFRSSGRHPNKSETPLTFTSPVQGSGSVLFSIKVKTFFKRFISTRLYCFVFLILFQVLRFCDNLFRLAGDSVCSLFFSLYAFVLQFVFRCTLFLF